MSERQIHESLDIRAGAGEDGGFVPRPSRRLAREKKTLAIMIALYCRDHHAGAARAGVAFAGAGGRGAGGDAPRADGLCSDCGELLEYATRRLDACRYGVDKPACTTCTTHCYAPAARERIREVMRYSGPRMLRRHPLLAVAHLMDGRKTPGDER